MAQSLFLSHRFVERKMSMEYQETPHPSAENQEPCPVAENGRAEERAEPASRWEGYSLSTLSIFFDHS
jgi:hypothetical protein